MTPPLISIVTPSYNQARFIEATLRSVLLQRYPRVEYIVLDGGSTDGAAEIVRRYGPHLAHWRSRRDGGHAAAVAEGLAMAKGEILAFLNSDDMLLPDTLHAVASYFAEHPAVDAVYGHRVVVDEAGIVRGVWLMPPHSDYLMSRWALIPQETCFWRRRLFESAGNIDPARRFALDYDLFARYMKAGRFARIDRFLGIFRVQPASKTSTEYETIGKAEIAAIQRDLGLHVSARQEVIGSLFGAYVQWRSHCYVTGWTRRRPGARQAVAYDVNELWGHLLDEFDLDRQPV